MPRVYRCNPAAALHHHEWDGQHVVYDDASGDTHLLGDLAIYLLDRLGDHPQGLDELLGRYAAEAGLSMDGELGARLKRALDALRTAGLVDLQT